MSTKVLVTGGCGFIGKALSFKLLELGFEVVIVDKNVRAVPANLQRAQIIRGDVCDQKTWQKLPPCDYVFHLAAPSSIILFDKNLAKCVQTTLIGLMRAFEWSKAVGVKKLIYPSSGSIFGKRNDRCNETTVPEPVNSYGKTKLACEAIAQIYTDQVPNVGLRIFAGYGPQEAEKGPIASVVGLFMKEMLQDKSPVIFGDGTQTRDFVYIDDIVDLLIKVMNNAATGVLNVGSGESVSFNQLVAKINALLGKKIKPTYISKPNAYLEKTACDPTKFKSILGREITSLTAGLQHYSTDSS